eukprot:1600551-Pyramimonas_sp.AAC.1
MSRADCISKLTTLFVAAVAATDPKVWPSARWTGFDHNVDWMGVLESCHGLLSRVFVRWSGVKDVGCGGSIVAKIVPMGCQPSSS